MSEKLGEVVELKLKVVHNFYEPLLLLNALGQVRGKRIKPELNLDSPTSDHQRARRSFADGIAYICAYDRGPDFVTAAALENSPQGVIVWLAFNANVECNVPKFLQGILNDLAAIAEQNTGTERLQKGSQIRESLLTRIITFNEARISAYHGCVKSFTEKCLPLLKKARQMLRKSTDIHYYTDSILK
jgi:hypothetical protein